MFRHRLESDPFFAHLRALDMECPRCGTVYTFSQHATKKGAYSPWDHETNRFRCHSCRLVLALGVLAWPVMPGALLRASDSVPTVRQSRELRVLYAEMRRQAHGRELTEPTIRGRVPRNIVLTDECPCQPGQPVHPGCPVHGHGR